MLLRDHIEINAQERSASELNSFIACQPQLLQHCRCWQQKIGGTETFDFKIMKFWGGVVTETKKIPGDSIRDLLIPELEVTIHLWKGHGSPSQKGHKESPGIGCPFETFFWGAGRYYLKVFVQNMFRFWIVLRGGGTCLAKCNYFEWNQLIQHKYFGGVRHLLLFEDGFDMSAAYPK